MKTQTLVDALRWAGLSLTETLDLELRLAKGSRVVACGLAQYCQLPSEETARWTTQAYLPDHGVFPIPEGTTTYEDLMEELDDSEDEVLSHGKAPTRIFYTLAVEDNELKYRCYVRYNA